MAFTLKKFFRSECLFRSMLTLGLLLSCRLEAVTTIYGEYESLAASGSTIVALDSHSDIYTSDDDGVSFTLREQTVEMYEAVAALGATAIAVGIDGLILRAPDSGVTWSAATSPSLFGSLYGVAGRTDGVNANVWVAVGDATVGGSLAGFIYRSSDDGLSWSVAETLEDISLQDVVWTGNRWLACGRSESFFNEGSVYSSTDGLTWSASTLPFDAAPLLALATDGNGTVIAVGENGAILRSTDDGLNFVGIAPEYQDGGDFNAVIADSSGTFYVGGDEQLILEIDGTTATTASSAVASADTVRDFVLINDVPAAVGGFSAPVARTIPFEVSLSVGGTLDYVLTVEQTLVGKTYNVETTDNLTADDWEIITGTSTSGTGGQVTFDVAENGLQRFWRIVEF